MPGLTPIDLSDDLLADNHRLLARLNELQAGKTEPTGPDPKVADLEVERDRLKADLARSISDLETSNALLESERVGSMRLKNELEQCKPWLESAREKIEDLESKATKHVEEIDRERSRRASALAEQSARLEQQFQEKLETARASARPTAPESPDDLLTQLAEKEKRIGKLEFDLEAKDKSINDLRLKLILLKRRSG